VPQCGKENTIVVPHGKRSFCYPSSFTAARPAYKEREQNVLSNDNYLKRLEKLNEKVSLFME